MRRYVFVMLMEDQKTLDADIVRRHVEHLRKMDGEGRLVLCGPFAGGGGMVVLRAPSYEEAKETAQSDPFVSEGYKTFRLMMLEVADKENGYLLD